MEGGGVRQHEYNLERICVLHAFAVTNRHTGPALPFAPKDLPPVVARGVVTSGAGAGLEGVDFFATEDCAFGASLDSDALFFDASLASSAFSCDVERTGPVKYAEQCRRESRRESKARQHSKATG